MRTQEISLHFFSRSQVWKWMVSNFPISIFTLGPRLGSTFASTFAFFCSYYFFFPRVLGQILLLRLLFMHCAWTVAAKFDLSNNFQPISAHCALFTDPHISLFSNFFIKNGSYGTIHTFKNYFTTVFFNFQFSAVSKRTLDNKSSPRLGHQLSPLVFS